jgi:hypothetical protein
MVDTTDTEQHEAFSIAVDMVMAKYHNADAFITTDRVLAFVAGDATHEQNERRMGMICQSLASMGGQLAAALGELSPAAVEHYFDGLQAISRSDAV